ncbi:MAG: glutamate racemase [bacterium]|nr:glutamate racemase [bacterium]
MSNENYIGIFDSGIGGLKTLEEIRKILPNENYLYYADSKNNPYGEKEEKELYDITKRIVSRLLNHNVKLIIIACNTATTKCIKKLRNEFSNTIFIGTEPAVKIACDNDYKNILVMATPTTIDSERMHILIDNNKKENQSITLLKCDKLANAIEQNNQKEIDIILKNIFKDKKNNNYDSIVLACTHYPYIKNKIQKIFPNADIIDGNKGVSKRVKYILETNRIKNTSKTKGKIRIIKTRKVKK